MGLIALRLVEGGSEPRPNSSLPRPGEPFNTSRATSHLIRSRLLKREKGNFLKKIKVLKASHTRLLKSVLLALSLPTRLESGIHSPVAL
jgi:hypothetical protein